MSKPSTVGRRVVETNPDFVNGYKPLIAALGHLGRRRRRSAYVDKLLELEPDFTVKRFAQGYPFKKDTTASATWKGCGSPACPEG